MDCHPKLWKKTLNDLKREQNLDLSIEFPNSHLEYLNLSAEIAKRVIEETYKFLKMNENEPKIEIAVGRYESQDLYYFYRPSAVTNVEDKNKNVIYMIVGKLFFMDALKTWKSSPDSLDKLLNELKYGFPLPFAFAHEIFHSLLGNKYPLTQNQEFIQVGDIIFPNHEIYTQLFTYLFWKLVYGNEIPEHKCDLNCLSYFYINRLKNGLEENNVVKILWNTAYLLGNLVGKELIKKYGDITKAINIIIERLNKIDYKSIGYSTKYEDILRSVIDPDVLENSIQKLKNMLEEHNIPLTIYNKLCDT